MPRALADRDVRARESSPAQARRAWPGRKFEATDERLKAAKGGKVALGGEAETEEQAKRRQAEQARPAGEEEPGMSRLLKAKQRAQMR